LWRDQLEEGGVRRGDGGVDRVQHGVVLVRAGDGQDLRVDAADGLVVGAEAAGDDDLAVASIASPMASRDSARALTRKPQVLTITASADS
jgi:hypothetical protein